jgi:hypothetical protein
MVSLVLKEGVVAVQTGCNWEENDDSTSINGAVTALYLLREVTLSYLVAVTTNRQSPAIQSIRYGVARDMVHPCAIPYHGSGG